MPASWACAGLAKQAPKMSNGQYLEIPLAYPKAEDTTFERETFDFTVRPSKSGPGNYLIID